MAPAARVCPACQSSIPEDAPVCPECGAELQGRQGVSLARAWGLFAVGSAAALAGGYGLMKRWGLPARTLDLAIALLVIGAGVMVATGVMERRRRNGQTTPGLGSWFTWGHTATGGLLALGLWAVVAIVVALEGPRSAVRLAVLPFENRGAAEDQYLVDGVTEQVRGKLASLGGFQVIARASSDEYRGSTQPIQEIGRELEVDYLLVGTVTLVREAEGPGKVQVAPQLISVEAGRVNWDRTFNAELGDVFDVQTEIASRVADALGVAIGAAEQQRLAKRPTGNLQAYDAFLRGKATFGADPSTLRQAARYFEEAIALDSTFAEAWAELSITLGVLYSNATPDPGVAARAKDAAERAMRLDPDGPSGHRALARYHVLIDPDAAVAEGHIKQALEAAPNDPVLLSAAASIERILGRWDEALAHLEKARRLDPRSIGIANSLSTTLLWMRRYPEALTAIDAALVLSPGELSLSQDKAMILVAQGNLAGARRAVRDVSTAVTLTDLVVFFATYWDMYWVLEEPQLELLLRLGPSAFDSDRAVWAAVMAQAWAYRGDRAKSRAFADTATTEQWKAIRELPSDPQMHVLHGLALAYAGRKDLAIEEGTRGVALLPVSRDAETGAYLQHQLARIYLVLGEPEKALDQLEPLLRMPYFLSPGWLAVDPTFAALKGNPRYEKLVAGEARAGD